jgi:hypothetical protein
VDGHGVICPGSRERAFPELELIKEDAHSRRAHQVKRSEAGAVLIGLAIAVGLGTVIVIWAGVFANSPYSNGGSNLLGIIVCQICNGIS